MYLEIFKQVRRVINPRILKLVLLELESKIVTFLDGQNYTS